MNKSVVKKSAANSSEIAPVYLYAALAIGVIVLCLISWKVYTFHTAASSVATVNAREAAKQAQNGQLH